VLLFFFAFSSGALSGGNDFTLLLTFFLNCKKGFFCLRGCFLNCCVAFFLTVEKVDVGTGELALRFLF